MNLDDFEPLGSNCEFGFILHENGDKRSSLLRWTSIDIAGLIHMLDARFDRCFDRECIRPHVGKMVINSRYNWALHSALGSSPQAEFRRPTKRFTRLFEIEQARIRIDIDVLTARLRGGGICCVFSGPALSDGDALVLRGAIDRFAGNAANSLLAVTLPRHGAKMSGELMAIGERCWHGAVDWLAPFDQANEADYANWQKLLSQVSRNRVSLASAQR